MIFTNRKNAARHFDIKHMLLPCLWVSQFTFKGAKKPKFGLVGTQGLDHIDQSARFPVVRRASNSSNFWLASLIRPAWDRRNTGLKICVTIWYELGVDLLIASFWFPENIRKSCLILYSLTNHDWAWNGDIWIVKLRKGTSAPWTDARDIINPNSISRTDNIHKNFRPSALSK